MASTDIKVVFVQIQRAEVEVLEADRKAEIEAARQAKKAFGAGLRGLRAHAPAPEVRGPLAALDEAASHAAKAADPTSSTAGPDAAAAAAEAQAEADEAADRLSPVSDSTPTGSRFRSWGAAAAASASGELAPPQADPMRRSYGRGRGQLDEALKELRNGRAGAAISGRKSLRRQDTVREKHRPLSRVFFTGDS